MNVAAAVAILTRIPVPSAGAAGSTGAAAFGVVGAGIGLIGAVPILVIGPGASTIAAILAVAAMAIVSGGLHLDGLADTTDALLAPDADGAERARKDPAIGVGGAIALILVIAAQVAALSSLANGAGSWTAGLALVAAGAASRGLAVVVVRRWRSRAPREGFGMWFASRVGRGEVLVAVGSALIVVVGVGLVLGSPVVPLGVALGAVIGLGVAGGIVRTRGQLDGDGMGATIELGVAAILVTVAVLPTSLG